MQRKYDILILGASYGSLLGAKLLLAGHDVHLVCLSEEADLINREGFRVRLPVRGAERQVEIDTRNAPGRVSASGTRGVDPGSYDLVALAMQEPQYASPGVRELMQAIAGARVPCMSIMNMPPLAYLARIPALDTAKLRGCYTDPSVWDAFDPALVTLCSPDPQAFRPPEEKSNVLQVSLPTNFKAARFVSDAHTAMLRDLEAGIEAIRWPAAQGDIELPVKLKVHDSVFVPLAKWSMLLTGNYRCVQRNRMRSIRDAVHGDLVASRRVYEWVGSVCRALGAKDADLVPFDKYAIAAQGLAKPSSAARALAAGAVNIERVDKLVQSVAAQRDMHDDVVDSVVVEVDRWLERNRARRATPQPA
ncbi:MAG TPA: 2-dehydropantoate 2-reductase N-terminal domain-containing protein [Casimicrobiaceae bacterium]|nr:2-dehydropantoate 2-reductase N-terminal domain-containing protein [Casimicrobiaceae bacterium]